jgi:hypothetical protein
MSYQSVGLVIAGSAITLSGLFSVKSTPFATYQLQGSKTQYGGIGKVGHEHPHKAYGFKILYVAYFA